AVAPEGSGKTTAYILGVLMRLKYSLDEAPKVLVLVKDQERGSHVAQQFRLLSGRRDLRLIELFGSGGMENEINELVDGTDIVVSTPARARAVYLKLGLNMNKLQTFIIDDADELIAAGQQLPINELARSAGKCQYLVFTTVLTNKLSEQIEPFMNFPTMIEVVEKPEHEISIHETCVYQVPNFQTKFNLLNYLLSNDAGNAKIIIYANSKLTARNIYKEIDHHKPAILQPIDPGQFGVDTVEEFDSVPEIKILIVAHETSVEASAKATSQIHVDIAENTDHILDLLTRGDGVQDQEIILMPGETEMLQIKKLENAIGKPFRTSNLETLDLGETFLSPVF
ncbi:MAG: DEAD/DEAH box helicase, partial [Chitinophagaceae bacterium]